MYHPGGDADGHADAVLASARPGHRGNTVGGKPPPTMMPLVQNSGAMAVTEWVAPAHSTMQEGGGAELTTVGSGGGGNSKIKGVQRLWAPP